MTHARASRRLVSIDFLRGLAVLAVVISHSPYSLGVHDPRQEPTPATPAWYNLLSSYGVYGVQLFLVISGFCIHMPWARSAGARVSFLSFWRRRLRRLYPPYFVAVLCSFGLLAAYYGFVGARPNPTWAGLFGYASPAALLVDVVVLALLCQNFTNASSRVVNGPFWSLALEEQLYMLYFPLVRARRERGWGLALPLTLGASLVWNLVGFLAFARYPDWWLRVGPSRWFEWSLGALAVEAHLGMVVIPRVFRSRAFLLALMAFAVALVPASGLGLEPWGAAVIRDPVFGLAFFTLIHQCVLWEGAGFGAASRVVDAIARVGVWSYAIYLIHAPLLPAVKHVLLRVGVEHPVLVVAARIALSLCAGYVFHRLVEVRFMNPPSTAEAPKTAAPPLCEEGVGGA